MDRNLYITFADLTEPSQGASVRQIMRGIIFISAALAVFSSCTFTFDPASARAIPGSDDYCNDRASTIVSAGSGTEFDAAMADWTEHCGTGKRREKGNGNDDKPTAQ